MPRSRRSEICCAAPARRVRDLRRLLLPVLILVLPLSFLALLPCESIAAPTLTGSLAWGWDDNVREAMDPRAKLEDHFLRFMLDGSPGAGRWGASRGALRVRGLAERYDRYATESRLQGEVTGEALRSLGGGATIWINGWVEGRVYPDSTSRNFRRSSLSIGASAPFHRGRVGIGLSDRTIDYRRNPGIDRRGDAFFVDYRRAITARLETHFMMEFEWARWDRRAIKQVAPDLFAPGGRQEDRGREARLTLRYLRGWLLETTFGWESVRSNSFGYSVGRRRIEAAVSAWLPGSVLAQLRGRLEEADYHDRELDRVFVIRTGEDVEAGEDSNSLTLRLRRQLIPRVLLEGRASLFRNESLLVGSRYDKRTASLGLVWAPVGQSDF